VGLLKVAFFFQQMSQIAAIGILQDKKVQILISKGIEQLNSKL
jgi:hypothetical protein